jgi:hypothetical protein
MYSLNLTIKFAKLGITNINHYVKPLNLPTKFNLNLTIVFNICLAKF